MKTYSAYIVLALALIIQARVSDAQVLTLRSGEHEGFSRLVLVPNAETNWLVQSEATQTEIRFPNASWALDSKGVFDLIPRTRIREVSWDDDRKALSLSLNCRCAVRVFQANGFAIAIDVSDEVEGTGPRPLIRSARRETLPSKFIEYQRTFRDFRLPSKANLSEPTVKDQNTQPEQSDDVARRVSLREFEDRLIRQLGQGSVEGIVVANPDLATPQLQDPSFIDLPDNFRLRTAFSGLQSDAVAEALNPSNCPPASWVDIVTWADNKTPTELIAEARATLTPTVGVADPTDRQNAAQKLIAAGFGLEAQRTLQTIEVQTEKSRVLFDLAQAIDMPDTVSKDSPLSQYENCVGRGLIWGQLASERQVGLDQGLSQDVAEAFNELPHHLKQHVGVALVKSFINRGHIETASLIRALIPKSPSIPDANLSVIDAELAVEKGKPEVAVDFVQDAINGNTQASRDALLKSLRSTLDAGGIPTLNDVELAKSFAFELQRTQEGGEIEILVARSLAALQDYSGAFTRLNEQLNKTMAVSKKSVAKAQTEVTSLVLKRGSDKSFLEFYSENRNDLPKLDELLTRNLAKRLLELGLPNLALQEIERLSDTIDEPTRVVQAKALLFGGRPRLALSALGGIDTAEAKGLRAEVLLHLDRYDEAALAFAEIKSYQKAQRAAFASGNATILTQILQQSQSDLGGREQLVETANRAPQEVSVDQSLASARNLLDRSGQSRDLINSVLYAAPQD